MFFDRNVIRECFRGRVTSFYAFWHDLNSILYDFLIKSPLIVVKSCKKIRDFVEYVKSALNLDKILM